MPGSGHCDLDRWGCRRVAVMELCRCLLRGLVALLLLQLAFACALAPASISLSSDAAEVLWQGTWLRSALICAGTQCLACVLNWAAPTPQSV